MKHKRLIAVYGAMLLVLLAFGLSMGMAHEAPLNEDDTGMVFSLAVIVGAFLGGRVIRFFDSLDSRVTVKEVE